MNKFLIKDNKNLRDSAGCTLDSKVYKKDCCDFVCLEDGTIFRECRYCNLSFVCRQVDVVDGKYVPMESHYLPIMDGNGELVEYQLFCTGMHDKRPLMERLEDDKVN